MTRLAFPTRWGDVTERFPNRGQIECSRAFKWFIDFMVKNWAYLLLNNREYWKPYLAVSAEAIRLKLEELPNETYRQYFQSATEEGGFVVALFIDNTMHKLCRPGGVIEDGERGARAPKLLQQSFWTGWKKIHGLKVSGIQKLTYNT